MAPSEIVGVHLVAGEQKSGNKYSAFRKKVNPYLLSAEQIVPGSLCSSCKPSVQMVLDCGFPKAFFCAYIS